MGRFGMDQIFRFYVGAAPRRIPLLGLRHHQFHFNCDLPL